MNNVLDFPQTTTMTQLMLPITTGPWERVLDGDQRAAAIYDRHYSRNPAARGDPRFAGPGFKVVLLTTCMRALFVWRVFQSKDPLAKPGDVNCAIFRNEGAGLASELIIAAEAHAIAEWGQRRFYTYVNPRKVRSQNPGCCFIRAGWSRCGVTKTRRLLILEKLPREKDAA